MKGKESQGPKQIKSKDEEKKITDVVKWKSVVAVNSYSVTVMIHNHTQTEKYIWL